MTPRAIRASGGALLRCMLAHRDPRTTLLPCTPVLFDPKELELRCV